MRRLRTRVILSVALLGISTACILGPAPTEPSGTLPPAPTLAPTESPTPISVSPNPIQVTVYFTDRARYAAGTPPFESPVVRNAPALADPPQAVLTEFFVGPTPEEQAQGLEAITSGFTGYSALQIQDGIARVYLTGTCFSNGATYTVAQPILANLLQFPDVQYVKVYDENGTTEQPDGPVNSIPVCLEP
jgi:hypothetical protein